MCFFVSKTVDGSRSAKSGQRLAAKPTGIETWQFQKLKTWSMIILKQKRQKRVAKHEKSRLKVGDFSFHRFFPFSLWLASLNWSKDSLMCWAACQKLVNRPSHESNVMAVSCNGQEFPLPESNNPFWENLLHICAGLRFTSKSQTNVYCGTSWYLAMVYSFDPKIFHKFQADDSHSQHALAVHLRDWCDAKLLPLGAAVF